MFMIKFSSYVVKIIFLVYDCIIVRIGCIGVKIFENSSIKYKISIIWSIIIIICISFIGMV